MELRINTESKAYRAIVSIAHPAGTARMYLNTLDKLATAILFNQDDLGMSDAEAVDTLRVLELLKNDIRDIADCPEVTGPVYAYAEESIGRTTELLMDEAAKEMAAANRRTQDLIAETIAAGDRLFDDDTPDDDKEDEAQEGGEE